MSLNYITSVERRLLAILINHPGQVASISKTLRDDSFADQRHQLIYDSLYALTQAGGAEDIDVADLLETLDRNGLIGECGGRDYILGLLSEPGTLQHKGLDALASKVEETAGRRRAADILKAGLGQLSDGTVDSEQAMSELQGQLREIMTTANREELAPVSDAVDELLEQLETGIDPGTPTGLGKLDWYVLGGFKPTQMVTLAGNTGSGKTSLALQIALRAAQWAAEKPSERGPVLIFSYEMARTELVQRMVGQIVALADDFHPPEGFSRRDRPAVREALEKLRGISMRVEDASDATIEAVRSATERFIYSNGILPSLVIVDHIGLMSVPSIKGGNRVAEVSHITKHLKRMASQLKIPVMALAQLSRANDKRDDHRPRLSDLRECLTGDTLVLDPTTGTRQRIDSMLEGQHVVLAMNERLRLVPASAVAIASGEKHIFRLRTANGREIRASANHPFYTVAGWKQLDELRLGEEIAVPRGYNVDGDAEGISADRARLLGYLIGDGSYVRHRSVSSVSADPETLEDARRAVGLSIVTPGYRPQDKRIDRTHLAAVAERLASEEFATLASSDLSWDPIVSITPDGIEMTYDLQVAGHHNFVANDIIVHNSGTIEHDSNVVLLIHKENYHEADLAIRERQDREGSPAHLYVAKNRSGSVGSIDLRWIGPRTLFYEPAFDAAGNELTLGGRIKGVDSGGIDRPGLSPARPAGAGSGASLAELGDMFAVTPDDDELTGSEGPEPF